MERHTVPTHLDTADGVGNVTIKQGVVIAAGIMVAAGASFFTPPAGPGVMDLFGFIFPSVGKFLPHGGIPLSNLSVALLILVPVILFAHPRNPPADHGLTTWIRYRSRPKDVAGADMLEYIGAPTVAGDTATVYDEYVAIWSIGSVSLRLAAESAVEVERARWAAFLNGIPCPIQTVLRSTPVDMTTTLAAIRSHGTPQSAALAQHLRFANATSQAVQRQRYLIIRNPDQAALRRHAKEITEGLARASLRAERLKDDELAQTIWQGWNPTGKRPRLSRETPYAIQLDGIWHSTVAVQEWPERVRTDFLAELTDGEQSADVVQVIERLDRRQQKDKLRTRKERLEHTKQTRERKRAIKQMDDMLERMEGNGGENIFRVAIYAQARGKTEAEAEAETLEVSKIIGEFDGTPGPLRWEQADGQVLFSGTLEDRLLHRQHRVDTSSISRAYPWAASGLAVEGGVPWGQVLHSSRWVTWQPWARPLIPSPNVAVYGGSGSGKGFGVKVITSRLFFAGQYTEMFAIDQAEEDPDGEYGRWARYCRGEVRKIRPEFVDEDLETALKDIRSGANIPPVIALNIADLGSSDRCRAMVALKVALFSRAKVRPARRALVVDEVWSFAEDKHVAGSAESSFHAQDLARRGRHIGLSAYFLTQRAQDALDSSMGEVIQSLCKTQLFLMQNPNEITAIAKRLRWTDQQADTVASLLVGQAMLEAANTRSVFTIDFSPEEWDMANTDLKVDTAAYDQSDGPDSPDRLDGEPAGLRSGNGPRGAPGAAVRPSADLPLAASTPSA